MSLSVIKLPHAVCVLSLFISGLAPTFAQTTSGPTDVSPAQTPPAQTVSVTPQETLDASDENATSDLTEQPEESFQLPAAQHPWAKFEPGAWREIKIVTTTYAKSGKVTKSTTTQKEILEAVAEDKYVLKIQATVDMVGRRIIGSWKKRILHITTDHAGPIIESKRSTFAHEAETPLADCEVWEVSYSDGTGNRLDRITYDPERYPHVLLRESRFDQSQTEAPATALQIARVTAHSVGYQHGKQLLECSFVRTDQRLAKGETQRMAFVSPEIPGGEVYAWETDFDAEGDKVRGSTTQVVAFGLTPEEPAQQP